MPQTGLWLRVFVGLLLAVVPTIIFLVGALLFTQRILPGLDESLVAVLVVVAAIAWAAVLGIVFTRTLAEDFRTMLDVAQRGGRPDRGDARVQHDQLASALEERNRQVAALAKQAGMVSINEDPSRVISALVATVRSVMGDATWRFAVLASDSADLLEPGVYEESRDPTAIGDLEQWASVSAADEPVRHVHGPWGAFVIVAVSASEQLRAVLYAPWEGRRRPSPAETDLLTLVGQHAGTALEHALLYARVRSQADALDRLADVQADFLRGVTHDLQTPLTSIAALATELRAGADLPGDARTDLENIAHQAERMRRMVSQLLVASRLEAGVVVPSQEVFSIHPLVERVWSALRADRPFSFSSAGEPHLVVADPDRTEQVLWALLDNAVKYSPNGSPITVRVEPRPPNLLAVSVTDQGTGMDPVTIERAFDQFYRAERARALAPDGSGVGLYAARGLVHAMGGGISLDSRLGAGTTVTVNLPAEPAGSGAEG